MKNAISMHVVYSFKQLEHVVFDPGLWEVVSSSY